MMIVEMDGDALRMNEGTEKAGAPLGSPYQYFSDDFAFARTPAERFNAEGGNGIAEALAPV